MRMKRNQRQRVHYQKKRLENIVKINKIADKNLSKLKGDNLNDNEQKHE